MALTDLEIRRAKPAEKANKLFDEKALYLLILTTGAKLWRLKYRFLGKEKLLALGEYPETTLAEARVKRDAARKILHDGADPMAARKREAREARIHHENTFEVLAREWHEYQKPSGRATTP